MESNLPDMKKTLQKNLVCLRNHLIPNRELTDFLHQEHVLTMDQIEEINSLSTTADQVWKLYSFLIRRPQKDFSIFLKALEISNQKFIKDKLLAADIPETGEAKVKKETENVTDDETKETMVDSGNSEKEEDMDTEDEVKSNEEEDESDNEDESESESEEEGSSGIKLVQINDFKKDTVMQNVTVCCQVKDRSKKEVKGKKVQFMAEVGDKSSAVDVCVRNEDLYALFEPGSGLLLRKVKWSGKVLFVSRAETATSACADDVSEDVMDEAFGTGPPISISAALQVPDHTWFSVIGKVVKVSDITKKVMYETQKILTHRQVRLQDQSEVMDMNFWERSATEVKLGKVYKITSCKKLPKEDGPLITTTRKSKLTKIEATQQFADIHVDHHFKSGILKSITVDTFQVCPVPTCYRFKLSSAGGRMICDSCKNEYKKQNPDYAVSTITFLSPKKHVHQFTVLWPQLKKLFKVCGKHVDVQTGAEQIKNKFLDLAKEKKSIKYHACGNVLDFKPDKTRKK